jgi:hypothetical protein
MHRLLSRRPRVHGHRIADPRAARRVLSEPYLARDVIVAIDRAPLRSSLGYALDRSGLRAVEACDVAALLDRVADAPYALVLSDPFDGVAAEALLAMLRTADSEIPALVVAPEVRNDLLARAGALAPVELLCEPSAAAARPCRGRSPRTPALRWLGRCIELATRESRG